VPRSDLQPIFYLYGKAWFSTIITRSLFDRCSKPTPQLEAVCLLTQLYFSKLYFPASSRCPRQFFLLTYHLAPLDSNLFVEKCE
jgi:hypothetical protein